MQVLDKDRRNVILGSLPLDIFPCAHEAHIIGEMCMKNVFYTYLCHFVAKS